jgi:hypothetical protein
MFRVSFFVDDKKLSYALWALTTIAIGKPDVDPVINAKKRSNGVAQQTGGTLLEMFTAQLTKDKPAQINARYVKQWMQNAGLNPVSHGHVLKEAQRTKLIRKIGKGIGPSSSSYKVL